MRITRSIGLLAVFTLGLACEVQPCDRYVNYVCDCHADDPEFDCDEISSSLTNADPAVQDQCAIDLADLQDADAEAGLVCSTEEG